MIKVTIPHWIVLAMIWMWKLKAGLGLGMELVWKILFMVNIYTYFLFTKLNRVVNTYYSKRTRKIWFYILFYLGDLLKLFSLTLNFLIFKMGGCRGNMLMSPGLPPSPFSTQLCLRRLSVWSASTGSKALDSDQVQPMGSQQETASGSVGNFLLP